MEEATFFVSYAPDFPGQDGPMHVFFANADCGDLNYRNEFISQHKAEGCLIDHQSRLADVEIPETFKLKIKQLHWTSVTTSIVR